MRKREEYVEEFIQEVEIISRKERQDSQRRNETLYKGVQKLLPII